MTDPQLDTLIALCRPGFEKECLAELSAAAAALGTYGWAEPENGSGFLRFSTPDAGTLYGRLPPLVFTRELWPLWHELTELPGKDRAAPIRDALAGQPTAGLLFCDTAEGDAYRSTARFAGKFVHPLRQALRQADLLSARDHPERPAWHALFLDSSHVLLGRDLPERRPLWPMGIARLKQPSQAPSRSTLKLEEAFHVFLGPSWRQRLGDTHTAVDLGAAPGGWTWQLVNQGLSVQAIDNGPMDSALMATGQVEHLQVDGFTWEPDHPVNWLVCDMVEQPQRVAWLMADWLIKGWARAALFNLKLPMKKRWQTWLDTEAMLAERFQQARLDVRLQARHLYFDREEITVCIETRPRDQ